MTKNNSGTKKIDKNELAMAWRDKGECLGFSLETKV